MTVRRQALIDAFKAPFDVQPSERVPALERKVKVILDHVDDALQTFAALKGAPATGEQEAAARLRIQLDGIDTKKSDAAEDLARIKASAEDLLRRCQGSVASTGAERLDGLRRSAEDKEEAAAVAGILAEMGPSALDAIVLSMGESKTEVDTRLVREAMSQRFKKTITGDLTHERATKTYRLLASVPEAHVRDNARFEELELTSWHVVTYFASLAYAPVIDMAKEWWKGEGLKDGEKTRTSESAHTGKKVILNYTRSSVIASADFTMPSYSTKDGNKTWTEHFSHTTLHEIGHAVDEGGQLMSRLGKRADCGAWRAETPATIARAAAASFGLYGQFSGIKGQVIQEVLAAVLKGNDPQEVLESASNTTPAPDEDKKLVEALAEIETWTTISSEEWQSKYNTVESQVQRNMHEEAAMEIYENPIFKHKSKVLDEVCSDALKLALEGGDAKKRVNDAILEKFGAPLTGDDMKRLLKHEAVSWCRSIKTGPRGVWWSSNPEALKLKDGRIYQESYEDDWWSYDADARKHGLSKYQFRAPGEWFAELYAFYHDDKLPPNHKHHDLISRI